ncbi:AAA family ATPase [Parasphaerochaeta coccoides]|uniref:Replication-associated recombination protein A n=1 Tax=Parasphaerochaeta coccoides (strain ATCC BAA-1237 / DSM 17374 / SPN1) TaxID=760011 RepID=F4GHB7_PARC1|nr:AAA family ATPase [Parasphaerochaeta coccoides]AEC02016.1 Recombination protein MgsA [Parasphaerochaeta coccoides DSM 17374]
MEDLFENQGIGSDAQPLAYRMRPRTLDEYIGQEHIVGPGRLLRRAIQADQLSSVIFYGPPGTGKTTLARVIANTTKSHFVTLNAVLSGVKELRYEIEQARERLSHWQQRTILFVDEVHRWNKSQQDALLPWVENGTFILIGATTENPYFEVNAALVSRSRIFQLVSLTDNDLLDIARQCLGDKDRGYGAYDVSFEAGALEHLIDVSNGDARSLLNALQLAVETTPAIWPPPPGTEIYISQQTTEESIQKKVVLYDKEGDYHFDIISAFIKSLRGSDPDAALYWLARMVRAGEDPRFIFRRMLISACEDIGLADPMAITIVEADAAAFDRIGLPEGRFHLTHAALYLATAPKSNSTMGFFDALKNVETESRAEVPTHLKDASRDAEGFGHGEGYLYPHAYRDHWVAQQYLPESLQGKIFYHPAETGYEARIRDTVLRHREAQMEAVTPDAFPEQLTWSPRDRKQEQWLYRTTTERGRMLSDIHVKLYAALDIRRHSRIMVLNAGHGLLLWEAVRKTPEGLVIASVRTAEQLAHLTHYAEGMEDLSRPRLFQCEPLDVFSRIDQDVKFEAIIGRNVLTRFSSQQELAARMLAVLAPDGVIALAETVPSEGSRLSDFMEVGSSAQDVLKEAEKHIYASNVDDIAGWNDADLPACFKQEGYVVDMDSDDFREERAITREDCFRWMEKTYLPALKEAGWKGSPDQLSTLVTDALADRHVQWRHHVVFLCVRHADTARLSPTAHSAVRSASRDKGTGAWKETLESVHGF